MAALGVRCVARTDTRAGYGVRATTGTVVPDNRHWYFRAPSRAAVAAFHEAGIAAGGRDDGPPGLRPAYHPAYYAAFLLDPDGNRIEAVCHRQPEAGG